MIRWNRTLRIYGPLILLGLLTVALTWPLARYLSTHVSDRQDPLLNTWIMAWEAHQLLRAPTHLYDANIFFPYTNTLAYSETLLSTTVLVLPIRWFGASALTMHNLAILLSFFTTALGAYVLALHLTHSRLASLVAAAAFAFAPYRYGHLSQVQLLATGWLPLSLLYLDRTLTNSRRIVHNAALFGLFFVLQALASFYSAFFAAGACLVYALLWWWLVARGRVPWRAVGTLAGITVVAALMLLTFARPYFAVQRQFDAGWTLADNETFSASLQAYLYAPPRTMIWGPLTEQFRYVYGPCCPPDTLFPGLTVLVLSLVALVRCRCRRRWLFAGLLLLGFVLSLGPSLKVYASQSTNLRLPYYWLYTFIPGINALRAPVRWALLVTLGGSILAAWAVSRRPYLAATAFVLVLIEFAAVPLRLVEAPQPPRVVEWLDEQPPTRILELPLAADVPTPAVPDDQPRRAWEVSRLLEYQYFSTWHWHTTPDGYSGFIPPRHGEFVRELQAFPSRRSIALLQGLNIQYVVVHEAEVEVERAKQIRQQVEQADALRTVACFTETEYAASCGYPVDRVIEVAPVKRKAFPSWKLVVTGEAQPGQPAPVWLTATTPEIASIPANVKVPLHVRWDGGASYRNDVEVTLPLVIEEAAAVAVPAPAPAEAGTYSVSVDGPTLPGTPTTFSADIVVRDGSEETLPPALRAVTLVDARIDELEPGTSARAILTWRALDLLERYYSISVRVTTADGTVVAQQDGPPGGEIPTPEWVPGNSYQAIWTMEVPPDARPPLHLKVLWYEPDTGRRVYIWQAQEWRSVVQLEHGR